MKNGAPEIDCSSFWDSRDWTQERSAIVPMRMQPPHRGHVNLLWNAHRRFAHSSVLVYDRPLSKGNPFTVEERITWMRLALDAVGIELSFFGTGGMCAMREEERRLFLAKISHGGEGVIVSLNPEVHAAAEQLAVHYMKDFTLSPYAPIHRDLREKITDNGACLRACLESNRPFPHDFLPEGINEAGIRRVYQSRFGS